MPGSATFDELRNVIEMLAGWTASENVAVIAAGVFNSGVLANPSPGATYAYAPAPPAIVARARALGCRLVAFPELAVTGYPPEDLVLKPGFVADNQAAVAKVAARTGRCAAVVGFVDSALDLLLDGLEQRLRDLDD